MTSAVSHLMVLSATDEGFESDDVARRAGALAIGDELFRRDRYYLDDMPPGPPFGHPGHFLEVPVGIGGGGVVLYQFLELFVVGHGDLGEILDGHASVSSLLEPLLPGPGGILQCAAFAS